ncbi:hypothetical protein [Polyangium sorediatum]|uniref:Lipoprotein n=1 Tax=Polyangium sorediatum TaxID=889274 RepID=A0ABT6P9Y6_9BACT|nr:hypothetical protein [Polyangium sorediatum]MDI1437422.1 hypothetical protein [Polyangium sorediatum]
MGGRWHRLGVALVAVVCSSACAMGVVDESSGGSESSGSGGSGGVSAGGFGGSGGVTGDGGAGAMGGAGGGGSAGGAGGASSSSSSGTGGNPNCGNGVIDPGEQCDGADFAGKTCASIGLGSGDLLCNPFCGIVASGCVPKEACNDFKDNDQDGLLDCADDTCFMDAACLDSCFAPKSLSVPGWFNGDSSGRPNLQAASCSPASGPEVIFEVLIPQSGVFVATVDSGDADFSVSLRTTCSDPASEIACNDDPNPDGGKTDKVTLEVVQGQKLYVVVDGAAGSAGFFNLNVDVPPPEFFCSDFWDDDQDGYVDCDDTTQCQETFECEPGAGLLGTPCIVPSDCAANAKDPACLQDWLGFPDGYCTEWCDLAAQDCPGDGHCADLGFGSVHGICLDGCTTDADCRSGYACVDEGYPTKVCRQGPELACTNFQDDDNNELSDCEDPSCQATSACKPGSKAAGLPCTKSNECYAGQNDPICLHQDWFGAPGGYCSEYCHFMDDCAPGSICTSWFFFPSGAGTCMRTCQTDAQCRPGYTCLDSGLNEKFCVAF